VSGHSREDLERLVYALPLAVAQDDEAATDALLEGLNLVELQALCAGLAGMVVHVVQVLAEKTGQPDPKATAVRLLKERALQAAAE
jgi:hypothetical protein